MDYADRYYWHGADCECYECEDDRAMDMYEDIQLETVLIDRWFDTMTWINSLPEVK